MHTPNPEQSQPIPHPRGAAEPPATSSIARSPQAGDLTPSALSRALKTGLGYTGASWGEIAAIDLLIAQGTWLARAELRDRIGLTQRASNLAEVPRVIAIVIWHDLAAHIEDSPASSGEKAILRLACHLAGTLPDYVAREWSVASILAGLDSTNSLLAVRAVAAAALGPDTVGPL